MRCPVIPLPFLGRGPAGGKGAPAPGGEPFPLGDTATASYAAAVSTGAAIGVALNTNSSFSSAIFSSICVMRASTPV